MEEKYLSDIVKPADFKSGKLNQITAPCGSGKTQFAITVMSSYVEWFDNELLYLIDSVNGKEALESNMGDYIVDFWGNDKKKIPNVTVKTYAQFAESIKYDKNEQWKNCSLVICDELQQCIKYAKIIDEDSTENLHEKVIKDLFERIKNKTNLVISISATPDSIYETFKDYVFDVPLYGTPKQYHIEKTIKYNNLFLLMKDIPIGTKGLIYVTQIKQMKKVINTLQELGHKANGFWSIKNDKHLLSDEQIRIRDYVLKHEEIPAYIDILVINASSETAINIRTNVDFVCVHSQNKDTITQVRGRIRTDIKTLYIIDNCTCEYIRLPKEYLNRKLNNDEFRELMEKYPLFNSKRELKGNRAFKQALKDCGYFIESVRTKQQRFTIIW